MQHSSLPPRQSRRPRQGRLLVIDDEPAVAHATQLMLRDYEVRSATSVDEAIALLGEDRAFDLILCDVMMPGRLGMALHTWVEEHHPALLERFVFITGGVRDAQARRILEQMDVMVLNKPFSSAILRHLMTEPGRTAFWQAAHPAPPIPEVAICPTSSRDDRMVPG